MGTIIKYVTCVVLCEDTQNVHALHMGIGSDACCVPKSVPSVREGFLFLSLKTQKECFRKPEATCEDLIIVDTIHLDVAVSTSRLTTVNILRS